MKLLREVIRALILENCKHDVYWGIAGAGIILVCPEDGTIYIHHRFDGKWAFPAGGIHIDHILGMGGRWYTPIPEKLRLQPDDPRFKELAIEELVEEAGQNGIPSFDFVNELITYEDCGFIFKTFIASVSLEEKENWVPEPQSKHAWEVKDHGWFTEKEWLSKDLHHGFTPRLINAIQRALR
jgi:8-oxo-dGTP pyrophosphatase MutT (NUDIX family)